MTEIQDVVVLTGGSTGFIHHSLYNLDSRLRGNDEKGTWMGLKSEIPVCRVGTGRRNPCLPCRHRQAKSAIKRYPFEPEIKAAAGKHGLDPDLVAAICFVESSFDPTAFRFEAKFQKKYIDRHPHYEKLDSKTRNLLSSSLGLMQVMGVVAHEHGLPLACLEDLLKPEVGLEYGCRLLAELAKKYGVKPSSEFGENPCLLTDAIAAYNAGTARRGDKGGYVNQGYVDKVLKRYKYYQAMGKGL